MFGLSARVRTLLAVLLAAGMVVAVQSAKPAVAEHQVGIEHFMAGLACIESSGRYKAVNSRSGAIGKYQIMPRNWRNWAGRVLGDTNAQPTPENQELVAHWRLSRLYANRGTWRRVAYWWLTGRSINDESRWTRKAARYVDRVMEMAEAAARGSSRVPRRCHPNLPESLAVGASSVETVRVRARALNVRRNPGLGNRITAIVRRGAQLKVLDQTELSNGRTWLRVELSNGRRGWVAGWYTRPVQSE